MSEGDYWTTGVLPTAHPLHQEHYATCRRCGAFVNTTDRHDEWHDWLERVADLARGDHA